MDDENRTSSFLKKKSIINYIKTAKDVTKKIMKNAQHFLLQRDVNKQYYSLANCVSTCSQSLTYNTVLGASAQGPRSQEAPERKITTTYNNLVLITSQRISIPSLSKAPTLKRALIVIQRVLGSNLARVIIFIRNIM